MKKKLGFTLVEIMIVVAIIALLTAIAIPAFLQYRRDARTSLCINNMRNIEHAKEAFGISRNKGENEIIYWTNINAYLNMSTTNYLECPEATAGTEYSPVSGTGSDDYGTITNPVACTMRNTTTDAFLDHEYTPGQN